MRHRAATLGLLLLLGGCAHVQSKPALQLSIQADPNTNQGGPLYMVVRKTDRDAFLTEEYDTLASAVLGKQDPAILKKEIIWPNDQRQVRVEKEKPDEIVGVYFFYAKPGRRWRFAVLDPSVTEMRVHLGTNEIESSKPGQ